MWALGKPRRGEPLLDEDPLAGLNVLEDDRFFIHDPAHEQHPESAHANASHEPAANEMPEIESLDLGVEEAPDNGEEPAPAPVAKGPHRTPQRKGATPVARHREKEPDEDETGDE